MEALNRAYSEIILNTTTEAATRVMQSERKPLRLQFDLLSTREETSRILLRLKRMLDAETAAAEMSRLSKQRKIDELEAQLDEAEGVIVDLRAELRQAHDHLDEIKNHNVQSLNAPLEANAYLTCSDRAAPENNLIGSEPGTKVAESGTRLLTSGFPYIDVDTANQQSCISAKVMPFLGIGAYSMDGPDLASMRSIETGLYRNIFTQRLRAIDKTGDENYYPGDGASPPQRVDSPINSIKSAAYDHEISSYESDQVNEAGKLSNSNDAVAKSVKDTPLKVCNNQNSISKLTSCRSHRCRSRIFQLPPAISWSKEKNNFGEKVHADFSAKVSKVAVEEKSFKLVKKRQSDKDQGVSLASKSLRQRMIKKADVFSALSTESCKSDEVNCPLKAGEENVNSLMEVMIDEDIDQLAELKDVTQLSICTISDREATPVKVIRGRSKGLMEVSTMITLEGRKTGLIDVPIMINLEHYVAKITLENTSSSGFKIRANKTSKGAYDSCS